MVSPHGKMSNIGPPNIVGGMMTREAFSEYKGRLLYVGGGIDGTNLYIFPNAGDGDFDTIRIIQLKVKIRYADFVGDYGEIIAIDQMAVLWSIDSQGKLKQVHIDTRCLDKVRSFKVSQDRKLLLLRTSIKYTELANHNKSLLLVDFIFHNYRILS